MATTQPRQFEQCSVEQLVAQFESFIQSHQVHQPQPGAMDVESLLQQLQVVDQIPAERLAQDRTQAEANRKALAVKVIKLSIATRIGQRFPVLDQRLFDLKRWIVIEWPNDISQQPKVVGDSRTRPEGIPLAGTLRNTKAANQECVEIPLVVARSQAQIQWIQVQHPNSISRNRMMYDLRCQFPGALDPELSRQSNEAFAILHEVYAQVYRSNWANLVTGDLKTHNPTVDALWIPELQDINFNHQPPTTRDPALVVRLDGAVYLVGTWQVEREQSIEDLIAEFS